MHRVHRRVESYHIMIVPVDRQELADRLAKFNASVQFSIGYNANNTKAWVSGRLAGAQWMGGDESSACQRGLRWG